MLFADSVFSAVNGAAATLVPVGPPNKYEDVAAQDRLPPLELDARRRLGL